MRPETQHDINQFINEHFPTKLATFVPPAIVGVITFLFGVWVGGL
jgi:hypothetical protein